MASLDMTERRQIAAQAHADMEMWLNEAQKWADRFQSPSSNADDLISAATYFIIAAGNICLHAQSIVEVAYNDRETHRLWYQSLDTDPIMKLLKDRRDRLSHGYIRRDKDFRIAPHLTVSLMETLSFSDRIVEAGRTFPLVVDCVGPHSANGGRLNSVSVSPVSSVSGKRRGRSASTVSITGMCSSLNCAMPHAWAKWILARLSKASPHWKRTNWRR